MKKNTFRHVGIVVDDLNKSVLFYKKYFGFKVIKSNLEKKKYINSLLQTKNLSVKTFKLSDSSNKIIIEFLKFSSSSKKKTNKIKNITDFGITHIALNVENIEKKYNLMKKNQVRFFNAPIFSEDKKVKVAFCCDPSGVFLELVEVLRD